MLVDDLSVRTGLAKGSESIQVTQNGNASYVEALGDEGGWAWQDRLALNRLYAYRAKRHTQSFILLSEALAIGFRGMRSKLE